MSASRKLLVVANPYPPMVSAGTARIARFLRHLPEHGWEPTVLTARAKGTAPCPPGVRVIRAPVLFPRRLLGGGPRSARITRWVCVPDPYAAWIGPAIYEGRRLLRTERFDAVFSSSPRPSVHLVAAALAGICGLPWLADYRDPWLNYEFRTYATRLHRQAQAALESAVLRRADAVSAINRSMLDDVVGREPRLRGRAHVIPNGFDLAEAADEVDLGEGRWFVHTGRLYGRLSQTEAFLAAFAELPADTKMLFLGIEPVVIAPIVGKLGLSSRVAVRPFVPHRQSLGVQRAADALVLIAGRQRETTTSKVFEYLSSGRPVFAVAPRESAVTDLLDEVGGGVSVPPGADLAPALLAFDGAIRAASSPPVDMSALASYDAGVLTGRLVQVLDGLVATTRRRMR